MEYTRKDKFKDEIIYLRKLLEALEVQRSSFMEGYNPEVETEVLIVEQFPKVAEALNKLISLGGELESVSCETGFAAVLLASLSSDSPEMLLLGSAYSRVADLFYQLGYLACKQQMEAVKDTPEAIDLHGKTEVDYLYCNTCKTFVDIWKFDSLDDAGHGYCNIRPVTHEELISCVAECATVYATCPDCGAILDDKYYCDCCEITFDSTVAVMKNCFTED